MVSPTNSLHVGLQSKANPWGALLLSISVFLAITAPIVPAFQWAKNGHPQTPMPVGSLPQPEGQTQKDKVYFSSIVNGNHFLFKPEGAEEGQWFKPNTEILLLHPKNRIYIGPIKRTYPVNVNITFYSKNGFSIQKNYIITDASWVYFSIPELKEFNSCFNNVSMNSFCYYKINVKPDWQPAFLKTVGFYIEEKYINEPNSWR